MSANSWIKIVQCRYNSTHKKPMVQKMSYMMY